MIREKIRLTANLADEQGLSRMAGIGLTTLRENGVVMPSLMTPLRETYLHGTLR